MDESNSRTLPGHDNYCLVFARQGHIHYSAQHTSIVIFSKVLKCKSLDGRGQEIHWLYKRGKLEAYYFERMGIHNTTNATADLYRKAHNTPSKTCVQSQTQVRTISNEAIRDNGLYTSRVMVVIVSVTVPRGDSLRPKVTVTV